MAGLDNVNETKEVQPAPIVKPVVAKGKFAMPSPTGAIALDPSILASMQEIIAQKEAKRNSFSEGLRDVIAYDVGYGGDLNKSLRERAAEKESNVADIFQMKNQIAQYKAAQEAQRRFEQMKNRSLGLDVGETTPGAGTTSGIQTAGAGTQTTGGMGMPPKGDPTYNALQNAKTEEEWKKIYNKWAEDTSKIRTQYEYNPALDQIVQFPVGNELVDMTLRQAKKLAENNPALKARLEAAYPTIATTAPTTGAPAAAPAAPVTSAAPTTGASAAPTTGASAAPTTTGASAAPTTGASAAPTTGVSAAPPAAPVTSAAPAAPKPGLGSSSTAIKANIEMQKDIETSRAKERVGNEEERLATMLDQGKKAVDRADTANRIKVLAETDPEMYGPLVTPGAVSSIGTLFKEGIKVGTHGQIALPSIEDMVRKNQKGATPEKLSRAREMEGYLRKVELDFSSAFKGQGAVSDNERKIVQAIAGSTSDAADLLRKKAAWLANSAQKDKDMKAAWENFSAQYGENVPYSRFERSPAAKQVTAAYEERLRKQFESEIKAYGNRPLVSAEEYDKGLADITKSKSSKSSGFKPSDSQKATFEKYRRP